jgi:hypothetical protein
MPSRTSEGMTPLRSGDAQRGDLRSPRTFGANLVSASPQHRDVRDPHGALDERFIGTPSF